MAKNKFTTKDLDNLYQIYDKARLDAKEAEADKKEAAEAIKEKLGATEEASTKNYVVTYKYDKDKEVEEFDEALFEQKEPKKHAEMVSLQAEIERLKKKYVKKTIVKGTRKLVVTRQEAE